MLGLLAQSPYTAPPLPAPSRGPSGDPTEVFFYAGVILLAGFIMGAAFFLLRQRLNRQEGPDPGVGLGFTLSDLRQMHAQGQITDEEYQQAKRKMIAKTRATLVEEGEIEADDGEIHFDDEDGGDPDATGFEEGPDDEDDDPDRP